MTGKTEMKEEVLEWNREEKQALSDVRVKKN